MDKRIFWIIFLSLIAGILWMSVRKEKNSIFFANRTELVFNPLPVPFTYLEKEDIKNGNVWETDWEWSQTAEDSQLHIGIYYKFVNEKDGLWLCLNEQIAQTDWDTSVDGVRFFRQDMDEDQSEEAIVILTYGSTDWGRDDIHIIDQNYDMSFPIDAYWEWVEKRLDLEESFTLVFLDQSVDLGQKRALLEGAKLSKELHIFSVAIEDGKIVVKTRIDADWDRIPSPYALAMLETVFCFDGEKFIAVNWKLKKLDEECVDSTFNAISERKKKLRSLRGRDCRSFLCHILTSETTLSSSEAPAPVPLP